MKRVIGSLLVAGGGLAVGVLAFPPAAALPAEPAAPCLSTSSCLPEPAPDPCTPVNGVDPCTPCADPNCLVSTPDVPPNVPNVPEAPGLPLPSGTPDMPSNDPAAADVPAAPAPTPEGAVPGEAGSSGGPRTEPAPAPGGAGSRPRSIRPPSRLTGAAAVAHTARSFAPLFVLAALVAGYLLVQGHLDRRDPKLSAAPVLRDDETVSFG